MDCLEANLTLYRVVRREYDGGGRYKRDIVLSEDMLKSEAELLEVALNQCQKGLRANLMAYKKHGSIHTCVAVIDEVLAEDASNSAIRIIAEEEIIRIWNTKAKDTMRRRQKAPRSVSYLIQEQRGLTERI